MRPCAAGSSSTSSAPRPPSLKITSSLSSGVRRFSASSPPLQSRCSISREADVYPRNHPERGDEIEDSLGDGSYFDATFGYYAHAVGPETAIAPSGWERRLVPIQNENTGGATGWCLEIHDPSLVEVRRRPQTRSGVCRGSASPLPR